MILTLDPSLRAFGWAIVSANKIIACGCIKTAKSSKRVTDSDTDRLEFISKELADQILKYNPTKIVFEHAAGSKSSRANQALAFVKGLVIGLAVAYNIPFQTVTAKEVKKGLTSNRNAEKDELQKIVIEKYPDFNEKTLKFSKEKKFAVSDAIAVYLQSTM